MDSLQVILSIAVEIAVKTALINCTMSNLTKERIGELQIIASVIFYAIAFVASRAAMVGGSKLGPISFAACRFLVSTVLLYLVKPLASKLFHVELESDDGPEDSSNNGSNKYFHLLLWGGLCGLANFGASTLAQIGLVTVSAGKAGFITGMYVVFIPLAEYLIPGYGIHVSHSFCHLYCRLIRCCSIVDLQVLDRCCAVSGGSVPDVRLRGARGLLGWCLPVW